MNSDEDEFEDEAEEEYTLENLTPMALSRTVKEVREMISKGDFREMEAQLVTQAMTLQRLFDVYTQKMITTEYLGAQEIYGSLALKSQAQCRKTIKTLFELKNPKAPTFIKEQLNTQINVKQTSGDA